VSHLKLRGLGKEFKLNVLHFEAPMQAEIASYQVQAMQHHFPIRSGQADLFLTIQFANSKDKNEFQNFVRQHQMNAITGLKEREVRLLWHERNIEDWTGFIVNYKAGSMHFSVAPKIDLGIKLVSSMLSNKQITSSHGSTFTSVLGPQVPWEGSFNPQQPPIPNEESQGLTPPTPPSPAQNPFWVPPPPAIGR
jgi:hypothetical protein